MLRDTASMNYLLHLYMTGFDTAFKIHGTRKIHTYTLEDKEHSRNSVTVRSLDGCQQG